MQTIIETIEQIISSKKSEIKYHQQEIFRIGSQKSTLYGEIDQLERELTQLKRDQEPKPQQEMQEIRF